MNEQGNSSAVGVPDNAAGDRLTEVRQVLIDALHLGERAQTMDAATPLLGELPELDSQAVVHLILSLEEYYGFEVDDDEISADTFATLGSLVTFVEAKTE